MSTETPTGTAERAGLGTLTNTLIECRDLETNLAFYSETLGFPVQARSDAWAVVDGGAGVLVLYQGEQSRITIGFTGADLDYARAQIEARGGEPSATAPHPNGEHFNLTDPEGNLVMISD